MTGSSDPLILEFGSRSGSWFALCFFGIILGVLGWGVGRELRRRSLTPGGRRVARAVGGLLFVGLLWLIYASSLSGFYEAEVDRDVIRLRYFASAFQAEIPVADVANVRPITWYRGRWRLQLVTVSGKRYESAQSNRHVVHESSTRMSHALGLPRP